MIARLKGILDEVGLDWIVIDVAGVGYQVFCPARVITALPAVGEPLSLHIETHVREDHIHLFGFASARERECFRMLTTVQGVGAKVGLGILGTLSVDDLTTAIVAEDKALLTRADGVGPRLAARLMTELKDKILSLNGEFAPSVAASAANAGAGGPTDGAGDTVSADAVSALVNLGYGRAEAFSAVNRAAQAQGDASDLDLLIPAALKELSQ
ncbi:MAG: Holliday junction branch migration protein RuvA [Rhodospirillaceae bacterium]|jgi:Holliday junction DNA helicase RuvA|nr:Holliday junction branch migration protein RuvA [Rhodospirillaceae bacterium]MBT4772117.1 Holliday junction branch migration protein RuvA [Rhodospirillaceae bacterium]MBT5359404.1 Holliday junction branch migration protein RuvA [Rhodospirillaceae bacterium]MBT5768403.1 Holliday junction branch migration protein RuvA [Rhodospirillaceae bacterium]MBT6309566.1 Holliday junction branch migration protein RuvA [Rhodospirillaceae bacterium]